MARVRKSALLEGISGRVGDLVFKDYGDKVVVCRRPVHDPQREPTPGERAQRERIREAAARAKAVLATEEGRAYYEAMRRRLRKQSAYHTAVFDFFGVPEVKGVRWQEGELLILVRDNVGVRRVEVEVDGDRGEAEPVGEEPAVVWCYRPAGPGRIRVWAYDGMGRIGEWEGEVGS